MKHFTTVSIIHSLWILNGLNGSINDYITSFEFEAIFLPSVITYLNIRSQFKLCVKKIIVQQPAQ